eukprot:GFUD01026610.1.p1 GENE.GFUD01026610.1~~GFUD01026610.1.p1  ORF type:complete len:456 (+),score=139.31 GFUD01026610.1:126-1493(+)
MLQKPEQVFDLKWNNFTAHLAEVSSSWLQDTLLLDISIQCGPELVRAHKLVLSACSPWFREVFVNMQANPSPLVVLWETKMVDMKNILSFMYNGEVQVEQDSLLSFLKLAKYLQVKGLTEGKEKEDEDDDKVLPDEEQIEKGVRKDSSRSPREEAMSEMEEQVPRTRENSLSRSRLADESRSRKENGSESRLRKEDFEPKREEKEKETKEKFSHFPEKLAEAKEKTDNKVMGKSDFEIKRDYERSKVREMRIKEVMKNAGKDKSFERYQKKKTNNRKESLGQELKNLQNGKSLEKRKETKVTDDHYNVDYEEHLRIQAMLERKNMLEKISNASLKKFESSYEQENSFNEDNHNPDFDPSLLVKTEIDESMDEEVDTSGPDVTLETSFNTSFSKPSTNSSWCTLCNKGPIAKMTQHMQNVHSEITYECKTCVKTFKCHRYLQNHKRQYCPERFTSK